MAAAPPNGGMGLADSLPNVADAYARHGDLSTSTVGRLSMGQDRALRRVAEGRVTIRAARKTIQWFSDRWPADVPRPPSPEDAA